MARIRTHRSDDTGEPDPVDIHVGSRARLRRTLLGFSQEKLARAIGVSFQQLQKYERGTNRISASRLFKAAGVLGVKVEWFFEAAPKANSHPPPKEAEPENPMASPEAVKLVRAYNGIQDPRVRRRVLAMVRIMSPVSARA